MSIRLIAVELYKLIREVEQLEKAVKNAPFDDKRTALENRLRKVRSERIRIQKILEGRKDTPAPSRNFRRF